MSSLIPTPTTLTTRAETAHQALRASLDQAQVKEYANSGLDLGTFVNTEIFRKWQWKYIDSRSQPSDARCEALWASQGLTNVRNILTTIIKASRELTERLYKARGKQNDHGKWHLPPKFLRSKKHALSELKKVVDVQNDRVMLLWIYSSAVSHSQHNVTWTGMSRDRLLTSALDSRVGSLQLYKLRGEWKWDWSLGLDLSPVSSEETDAASSPPQYYDVPARISFRFFTEVQGPPADIQTIVVENLIEASLYGSADEVVIPIDAVALPISVRNTELSIIPDRIQQSTTPSHLRILSRSIGHLNLPFPLIPLTTPSPHPAQHPQHNPYSSSATKRTLAYTLAHNALYLLGTPWLALLNSKFLLRYKLPNQQEYTHLFLVSHLDPNGLYQEDPGALLETSQLFHIGLLLLHIALPTTPLPLPTLLANSDDELIALIPDVLRAMGEEYCRAMASCLVYRRPQEDFGSPLKYTGERYGRWMEYLTEFLEGFYKEVFLPLKVLREIYGDDRE